MYILGELLFVENWLSEHFGNPGWWRRLVVGLSKFY